MKIKQSSVVVCVCVCLLSNFSTETKEGRVWPGDQVAATSTSQSLPQQRSQISERAKAWGVRFDFTDKTRKWVYYPVWRFNRYWHHTFLNRLKHCCSVYVRGLIVFRHTFEEGTGKVLFVCAPLSSFHSRNHTSSGLFCYLSLITSQCICKNVFVPETLELNSHILLCRLPITKTIICNCKITTILLSL